MPLTRRSIIAIVLISLGGPPGVGKSTIASGLARQIHALHLRIDSIEQAIRDSAIIPPSREVDDAGYRAAYAVAADNLRLGHIVIADCVNPVALTRNAWREVAKAAGVDLVAVEIVCSDRAEHQRRVETRVATVRGLTLPTWPEVVGREYEAWEGTHMVIDTAQTSVEQAVLALAAMIVNLPACKSNCGQESS